MIKFKIYIPLFILVLAFCQYSFSADKPGNNIDGIARAMKQADAKELAEYFSNTIDMTIPGNEGTYSKSQAEMIMKDFFSKYVPVSFSIQNKGNSKKESQFVIGELITNKGKFRTFFMMKEISGKYYLQQLKIEKQ